MAMPTNGSGFAVRAFATRNAPLVIHAGTDPCRLCESRHASICDAVEGKDLARLADLAVPARVPAAKVFLIEGDPADSLVNIRNGVARLFKSLPDGRRQLVGFAGPGHFLGLSPAGRYVYSAEAIGPVELCRYSRSRMAALLADLPALEGRLLERVANELATAQEQILLLGRKTARERLATFLLARAALHPFVPPLPRPWPCPGPAPVRELVQTVVLPMTRQDIADYLGLTIETVSRTFGALKRDDLIALPRPDTVLLLALTHLAEMAAGEN